VRQQRRERGHLQQICAGRRDGSAGELKRYGNGRAEGGSDRVQQRSALRAGGPVAGEGDVSASVKRGRAGGDTRSTRDLLTCLVLVFIDALADAVLLAVDSALLTLGKVAVVRRHIFLFAVLNAGFALFEVRGLLRVQLSA